MNDNDDSSVEAGAITARTPADEAQQRHPVAVQFPKDGAFWPSLLTFLSTSAGKAMNEKLAEVIGAWKEAQQQNHVINLLSTAARYLLMAGVMVAACFLQSKGKLDSGITGLLGLALGFLFGRQKSQE